MVIWIRCGFVHDVDRFTIQSHKLALEANVPDLSHIFIAITPVVLNKDGDRGSGVPEGTIQR